MVNILKGQRDRYRNRMMELEAQRDAALREVEDQRLKSERLLADNVSLFEKIRYEPCLCACVKLVGVILPL